MTTDAPTFRCGHPKTPDNSRPKKDGYGRYYPNCMTCYRANEQRRKERRRLERQQNGAAFKSEQPSAYERTRRFPVEPLLAHVRHVQLTDAQQHAVKRATESKRLTLLAADKVAVALGTHPGLIWPEWFSDVDLEETA